jgi:PAS domain S-box-containing protein
MWNFKDAPIRQKLTLVIALTSTCALLLVTAASLAYETVRFRHETVLVLTSQAQLVSDVSAPALVAGDHELVDDVLSALATQAEVVYGRVFGADGRLLAEYQRADAGPIHVPLTPQPAGPHFEPGLVSFSYPMLRNGQELGTLMLGADLRELHARFKGGATIMAVAVLASLLLALVLGRRLQRTISDPILSLAQLAQRVAAQEDYSLRGTKHANDEIGVLVDGFNGVLSQVERREQGLRTSEQRFRQLAESIREVFWLSDVAKTEMLYVSPGYEEIWGRTCSSLLACPRDWLQAIHPEDRTRVQDAALSKQARGDYDEEYRILRPDGSARWIRDRAFPVRDGEGQVYRVAGIAEDITPRKRLEKQILEISDREQARIGADLHDGLCQLLVSIGFNANLLQRDLEARNLPEAANASRIARKLAEAIRMARDLARGLHPVKLPTEGLGAALEALAADTSQDCGVNCTAECAESVVVHDPNVATHLYRIAQEAVHNALKHAGPTRIRIRLAAKKTEARLSIRDDGCGITLPASPGPGMGLEIMRYRAGMIGGRIEIERADAGGTVIACSFRTDGAK